MGTDQAAATGVALFASGSKEGPPDAHKEEEKLTVEEKEDGDGDEPDSRRTGMTRIGSLIVLSVVLGTQPNRLAPYSCRLPNSFKAPKRRYHHYWSHPRHFELAMQLKLLKPLSRVALAAGP